MILTFLKVGSPTWNLVWERIRDRYGDQACRCEQTGEVWQYMGSTVNGDDVEHQFRHRSYRGERAHYNVQCRLGSSSAPVQDFEPTSGIF